MSFSRETSLSKQIFHFTYNLSAKITQDREISNVYDG